LHASKPRPELRRMSPAQSRPRPDPREASAGAAGATSIDVAGLERRLSAALCVCVQYAYF